MDIDAMFPADAPASTDAQPQADAKVEEQQPENTDATTEQAEPKPVKTPWPKEAENALSRAKGNAARYKQQAQFEAKARAELEAKLAQYEKSQQPQQAKPKSTDGAPREEDYETYAEFMDAKTEWKLEQKFAERETKAKESQESAQKEAWRDERKAVVAEQTKELLTENKDILPLLQEYSDLLDELPPAIDDLFLEADNGALAFLNLAREGKLEALLTMSPTRAAIEIDRAQRQTPSQNEITKAPPPLSPARGVAATGKSLSQMSPKEVLKAARS